MQKKFIKDAVNEFRNIYLNIQKEKIQKLNQYLEFKILENLNFIYLVLILKNIDFEFFNKQCKGKRTHNLSYLYERKERREIENN